MKMKKLKGFMNLMKKYEKQDKEPREWHIKSYISKHKNTIVLKSSDQMNRK